MKKFYCFLSIILINVFAGTAQITKIEHTYFTSWFSANQHIPVVISYTLTQDMLQCPQKIKRKNKFKPDPALPKSTDLAPDYKGSGFDRGHNMPAGDNECSEKGMSECFYFSNMTPQPHSFNAGLWEELENLERKQTAKYQKVIVVCGSLGERFTIGKHKVVVPEKMWKVIYVPADKIYKCFIFPNADGLTGDLSKYQVLLDEIKKAAKVDFKEGAVLPGF